MNEILTVLFSSGITLFLTKEGVSAFKQWKKKEFNKITGMEEG